MEKKTKDSEVWMAVNPITYGTFISPWLLKFVADNIHLPNGKYLITENDRLLRKAIVRVPLWLFFILHVSHTIYVVTGTLSIYEIV